MTDTLVRPSLPRPARPAPVHRSPLTAGTTAALWAALAGLVALAVPVLVAWAADARSGSGAGDAVRGAGQLWLVAHSTSLSVPGGTLGLSPLGLAAVPFLLLVRAGGHAARQCATSTWREAALVAGAVAAPYAVIAAVVSSVATTAAVRPAPVQALLGALLVALLGAGTGAVRARRVTRPLPHRVVALGRGVLAATCVLLAAGAVLAAGSLLLHLDRAVELARATAPGAVGGVALLLLGLALVPNAAVWGAAWLAGPGFAVGVATAVGPFSHDLGAVPALPLLAALPSAPAPGWVGVLALSVPLLAGAAAGRLVVRRTSATPLRAALDAAVAGPVTGLVLALLCLVSGGPLGGGRLVEVGPTAWLVGLVVAVEVAVGAAVVAAVTASGFGVRDLPRLSRRSTP